eukprot:Tamp_16826.p2 GENE.Tamp_16826~~Tamp_16826.p2  ORF type:complete len:139 (+),score=19.46 Tamp_16826:382-798(+)
MLEGDSLAHAVNIWADNILSMDSGWGLPGLKGPTGARTPSDGAVTPKDILDFEARLKSRGKDSVQASEASRSLAPASRGGDASRPRSAKSRPDTRGIIKRASSVREIRFNKYVKSKSLQRRSSLQALDASSSQLETTM